jgi:Tfp pilus assembly protein PilF
MNSRSYHPLVLAVVFFFYFLLTTPLGLFNDWVPLNFHSGFYSVTEIDPGDDSGYYAYLRSIFFDGDIDFYNEMYYAHVEKFNSTGYVFNNWQIGQSILFFPFFLLGHLWALVLNSLNFPVSLDGYSFPYYLSTALAAQTYSFLGLLLTFQINRKYFSSNVSIISTLLIWLASPLLYYTFVRQRMAHTTEFFLAALFIWYWLSNRNSQDHWKHAILGGILGFLCVARVINVVMGILYILDQLQLDAKNIEVKKLFNKIFNLRTGYFYTFWLIAFSVQFLTWFELDGVPLPAFHVELAQNETTSFSFQNLLRHSYDFFLGERWGLLWSAPIILLGAFGVIREKNFLRIRLPLAATVFGYFSVVILLFGYLDAYEYRYLSPALPIVSLGIGVLLSRTLSNRVWRWLAMFCVFIFLIAQYFIFIQYKITISHNDPKFIIKALSNIPTILTERPELILRSSNFFRFLFFDLEFNWTYKELSYFIIFPFLQLAFLVFSCKIFCWLKKYFVTEDETITKKICIIGALIILSINITLIVVGPSKSKAEIESRKNYLELKAQSKEAQAKGEIDEVISLWEKAVKAVPEFWMAHLKLAISQEAKGLIHEAHGNYEKALSLNPNRQIVKYHMAQNLIKLGELGRAEELLRLAIKNEPQNSKSYQSLALLLARKSRFEESESLFKQTLTIKPDFGKAHFNFAVLLMKLKRPQEAITHMKLAIDLGVKDPRLDKMAKFLDLKNSQ